MKVLIDAHMLGNRETGNETYIKNLALGLSTIAGIHCAAAIKPGANYPRDLRESQLSLLPLRPSNNLARLAYTLPNLARQWAAELLHVTYVSPLIIPCSLVVSVHDVSFKRYPTFFSPRDRLLFRTLLPFSLKRASAIITISKHARSEILAHYKGLGSKIYVTPLAPSPLFREINEERLLRATRNRYGIQDKFILAVGNLQPRKNIRRLISAFSTIRHFRKDIQLVIVGKAEWKASTTYKLVECLGLEDAIVFTGYLPDEELILLYNAASVFVYPSLYEGFGLPILEAMACGVPVVTSKTSAMPEVAGDAAILIDPYEQDEMTEAILQILNDSALSASLVDAGLDRAQKFSWQQTARQTASIYREVLDNTSANDRGAND